ncbi:MAG: putative signal transducing protein [Isosphaeraceae bacterium]
MEEMEDEVPEIRLCEVANEAEAAMVVNLLKEEDIPARSDATASMPVFGGLPFESGHAIFVPASQARKAREILSQYPHFKNLRNVHEPEP